MPVDVKYTTAATATGGRDGRARTEDGSLEVRLATPKELGGAGGPGNNPEQLFAAGYAACFLGAMKAVAAKGETAKVPQDATVKASVGIGPRSEGGFGLDIALDVSLPGVPRERAQELVEKAHQVCPYSNATRNNIPVRLNVVWGARRGPGILPAVWDQGTCDRFVTLSVHEDVDTTSPPLVVYDTAGNDVLYEAQ